LTVLCSQTPIAEPDFLDLDAVPGKDVTDTGNESPPAPFIDLPPADTPPGAHDNPPDASTIPETPEVLQPSSLLGRSTEYGIELAAEAVRALKEEETDHVGRVKDQIAVAQHIAKRRLAPHMLSINAGNEDQGDDTLPAMGTEDVQAPLVAYKHDVVLDMEGYHARERSDRTVTCGEIDTVADKVHHEVKKQ
jgi:hypothetical protein